MFDIAATNINTGTIGWYQSGSYNVTAYDQSNTTATFTKNAEGSDRTITLCLSAVTYGGETVYASGSTTQLASRSSFAFENNKQITWDTSSVTITFDYAYLTNNSVSLTAMGGAYFNSGKTQASSATTITTNASSRMATITIYFDNNTTPNQRTFTVTASGNVGEGGEPLSDSITVTQNAQAASLGISFQNQNPVWSATTHSMYVYVDGIDVSTIGFVSSGSSYIGSFNLGGLVTTGTYDGDAVSGPNSGTSRTLVIEISAYTSSHSEVLTATAQTTQQAFTTGQIMVTPDGTAIGCVETSVTFTVVWYGLKEGTVIEFDENTNLGRANPQRYNVASWSGTTTVTATVPA